MIINLAKIKIIYQKNNKKEFKLIEPSISPNQLPTSNISKKKNCNNN